MVSEKECLFNQGQAIDRVIFITDGSAQVEKDGEVILDLKKGDLVADVNYITDSPCKYTISALEDAKIIYWKKSEFEKLVSGDADINSSWQSLLSGKLAMKLASK